MPAQTKNALLCALTILTLALAGCAEPEETGEPVGDDGAAAGAQYVMLGDTAFKCDDTVMTDDVCGEYIVAEEVPADAQMGEGTLNEDGTATINGRTYECDDTVNVDAGANDPACEEWILAAEA